jgi:hypothetical protein
LIIADEDITEILKPGEKIVLHIAGASAFIFKGYLERATQDIDTYNRQENEIEEFLERYDISSSCNGIMNICDNYISRLERLNLPLRNIDAYLLSDYDMIIAKMCTTRSKDFWDIINSGILDYIDIEEPKNIIKEDYCGLVDIEKMLNELEILLIHHKGG